jgi:hypothetical protein
VSQNLTEASVRSEPFEERIDRQPEVQRSWLPGCSLEPFDGRVVPTQSKMGSGNSHRIHVFARAECEQFLEHVFRTSSIAAPVEIVAELRDWLASADIAISFQMKNFAIMAVVGEPFKQRSRGFIAARQKFEKAQPAGVTLV